MKIAKVLSIFAIASLAVVSCGPQNKNNPTSTKDPAPAAQEANAGKMVFDPNGNDALILSRPDKSDPNLKEDINVVELEFFRAGAFLGKALPIVKAVADPIYFSGTFSKVGNVYKLLGDIKVDLEVKGNGKVEATKEGGEKVTVTGSYTPSSAPTNNFEKGLCVSWTISQIEAAIDSPKVEHKWSGTDACDLKGIAAYINQHGGKLNLDAFEGYVIESIDVNASPKTIVVNFKGANPVVGEWSNLNISNGSFKYHLETQLSGKLFKGDADGTIQFNDDYSMVTISLDVTSNELNGKVILTAKRK